MLWYLSEREHGSERAPCFRQVWGCINSGAGKASLSSCGFGDLESFAFRPLIVEVLLYDSQREE